MVRFSAVVSFFSPKNEKILRPLFSKGTKPRRYPHSLIIATLPPLRNRNPDELRPTPSILKTESFLSHYPQTRGSFLYRSSLKRFLPWVIGATHRIPSPPGESFSVLVFPSSLGVCPVSSPPSLRVLFEIPIRCPSMLPRFCRADLKMVKTRFSPPLL